MVLPFGVKALEQTLLRAGVTVVDDVRVMTNVARWSASTRPLRSCQPGPPNSMGMYMSHGKPYSGCNETKAFLDHQITSNRLTNHQAQAAGRTGIRPVHLPGSFSGQPV